MSGQALDPEFEQSVRESIRQVSPREIGPITADGAIADLGLDSVSVAELFIVLENTLDVTIEDDDLVRLKTFGDLQVLVARLRATPQERT